MQNIVELKLEPYVASRRSTTDLQNVSSTYLLGIGTMNGVGCTKSALDLRRGRVEDFLSKLSDEPPRAFPMTLTAFCTLNKEHEMICLTFVSVESSQQQSGSTIS